MFIEVKNMPKEYEHLRTCLQIEQSRCLLWGEKVGLAEELLDQPSKLLQLNSNLVVEVLQQVQLSFRGCMTVTTKYNPLVATRSIADSTSDECVEDARKHTFLDKTLAIWSKGGRLVTRIEWAMLRKGGLEKLIARLVQYNNRMESFLDRSSVEELHAVQAQTHLALLQVANEVEQIHDLVRALRFTSGTSDSGGDLESIFSDATTLVEEPRPSQYQVVASLAEFKAHHLRIMLSPARRDGLNLSSNDFSWRDGAKLTGRQPIVYKGQEVWMEWRESVDEALSQREYRDAVVGRVKELAAVLSARDKPAAFRSPQCLGYYESQINGRPRYALVYEWPSDLQTSGSSFTSLRGILSTRKPTLNARLAMANMLAASVLYLHAVGWVHKDIQSENVLFVAGEDQSINPYEPFLSGYEFSRPALPTEVTVAHQFSVQHDMYRHPDLLTYDTGRSRKLHDIYSLGLVLAEIAVWKPIESITAIEMRRRNLPSVRSIMLDKKRDILGMIAEKAGWAYSDVVKTCIEGFFLPEKADDEEPAMAVKLSNALHREVVQKLQRIQV